MAFIKTENRSKVLLSWLIETKEDLDKLHKDRSKIINNNSFTESEEAKFLYINSERAKELNSFKKFCIENIVSWHLDYKEQITFNSIRGAKEDRTVNYQM